MRVPRKEQGLKGEVGTHTPPWLHTNGNHRVEKEMMMLEREMQEQQLESRELDSKGTKRGWPSKQANRLRGQADIAAG